MNPPPFTCFVGVDQTGAAVDGGRRARPLPCAVWHRVGRGTWRAVTVSPTTRRPLRLASLSREDLQGLLAEVGVRPVGPIALMLDCVFGMPQDLPLAPRVQAALRDAARFRVDGLEAVYGRAVAEAFFRRICAGEGGRFPVRRCEVLAKANSIFRVRPYQKNIQTGTYRIWRDLGTSIARDGDWLRIWPFDAQDDTTSVFAWAFEAFPSLLWRELLGLRTRDLGRLRAACEGKLKFTVDTWTAIAADADAADAFVLALGGALLQSRKRLWGPEHLLGEPWLGVEGWIAGL